MKPETYATAMKAVYALGMLVVLFFVLLSASMLSGCTATQSIIKSSPERIGAEVDEYCKNVSSGKRDAFRSAVNAEAQPHRIEVYCYTVPADPSTLFKEDRG